VRRDRERDAERARSADRPEAALVARERDRTVVREREPCHRFDETTAPEVPGHRLHPSVGLDEGQLSVDPGALLLAFTDS
jgi:hypothetical protein